MKEITAKFKVNYKGSVRKTEKAIAMVKEFCNFHSVSNYDWGKNILTVTYIFEDINATEETAMDHIEIEEIEEYGLFLGWAT